jgi:2'-5' RNA ligase
MDNAPLILTLTLDTDTQHFFNTLRQAHFPAERNYLDAHLTLFHHLPPNEEQIIQEIELAVKTHPVMPLRVTEIKSIGNGVAYKIESPELMQLHHYLQKQWAQWLIPQDTQKLWPHVTVQNKVDASRAQLLKAQLESEFKPFEGMGTGLSLFEYLNGPWGFIRNFGFQG